jgi:hypothetical protein
MKNSIILILFIFTYRPAPAQPHIGFEQYYCTGSTPATTPVTRVFYQGSGREYVEARYNYDTEGSLGISLGRTFSVTIKDRKDMSWSVTPTIGVIAGRCQGVSFGTNFTGEYQSWSFSTSIQAAPMRTAAYAYSWSELGRSFGNRFYLGAAIQQDCRSGSTCLLSPGITGQLMMGAWTFPVYVFNPVDKRVWLLLGIVREWTLHKTFDHHEKPPVSK